VKALSLIFLIALSLTASAQNLYVKTFGKASNPAVVFLHGGPGYNAASFEATTAQTLADSGFYVIVYDRRGEGRSKDPNSAFNFQQSVSDLDSIRAALGIKRISLIGHSFGGVIGMQYAEKFPEHTYALILVSAPINLQESFRTIIKNCQQRASEKKDTTGLNFLSKLAAGDTSSLMYSSMVFGQAMRYGLYSPKTRTEESKAIFERIKADSSLSKATTAMSPRAAAGFYKTEKYTTMNMRQDLQKLLAAKVRVFAIYGQEDGLYSEKQVRELSEIVGAKNLKYLAGCSHNVFIDQQREFIAALRAWCR
jgi:proline iminopeptidase